MVAHVEGSHEELERRARAYVPARPFHHDRRRLLRDGDGFLLVVDGAWRSFLTRFTVAELLEDSAAPREPEPVAEEPPAPEPAEAAPPPSPRPTPEQLAERDEDGVPVLPSWLGRRDLP